MATKATASKPGSSAKQANEPARAVRTRLPAPKPRQAARPALHEALRQPDFARIPIGPRSARAGRPGVPGVPGVAHQLVWTGAVRRAALRVSAPSDPAEREAEDVSRRVMRMAIASPAAMPAIASHPAPSTASRAAASRAAARTRPAASLVEPDIAAEIRAGRGAGAPLPASVQAFMAPRFQADFSAVRIHTTPRAADLAGRLQARAFTYGRDVFFGRGQFQPDSSNGRELIAHELTHTIQQREVIQRRADVALRAPMQVQRWGVDDALNDFAGLANNIPGFRMLTIILGMNPINMQQVERSAANILRAVVEFMPLGGLIVQALDKYGVFDKAGAFVEAQLRGLGLTWSAIKASIGRFIDGLHFDDILHPGDVWDRAKHIVTEPIERIKTTVAGIADAVVTFVKDAILVPLGEQASKLPGWDLLTAVLGHNPITGAEVPRNAETLIGGFMKLIGQADVWENIKRGNAVAKCWAWFEKASAELRGAVAQVPKLFIDTLHSLGIQDLIAPIQAFARVAGVFGGFAVQFVRWAGETVLNLLEIVVEVVKPGAMTYLRRTGAALKGILKNPIPFVGNLVKAAKRGLQSFADNTVTHLKTGLIEWLTGALEGVYIPQAFSLAEIGKFALSVLGVTWAQIRGKIVKALGPTGETIMKGLETTFDVVRALVRGGPAAAWEVVKEKLGNLKDMVIAGIIGFVVDTIVKKAIPKLVAMFIPGAGFISAILSIYDTVMVFVQKLSKIAQVVMAFVDGIVAIAAGQIDPAAKRVETTLAGLLSLAISFLAGFLGLGNIAAKISGVIEKVRAVVDKALETAVTWIVGKARKLGGLVAQAGVPQDPYERLRLASQASLAIATRLPRSGLTATVIARAHDAIKLRYALTELTPYQQDGRWFVRAVINPPLVWRLPLPGETSGTGGVARVAATHDPATGALSAGVEGYLLPGQTRATAPNFNNAMPRIATLPGPIQHFVQNFEWAHLYGPGFGDEAATGLMLASPQVNRQLQSLGRVRGIEGYLREMGDTARALGGSVRVRVTADSFTDPPPGVPARLNVPVLKHVVYNVTLIAPDGRTESGRGFLDVGPLKPNGTGGLGTFNVGTL